MALRRKATRRHRDTATASGELVAVLQTTDSQTMVTIITRWALVPILTNTPNNTGQTTQPTTT